MKVKKIISTILAVILLFSIMSPVLTADTVAESSDISTFAHVLENKYIDTDRVFSTDVRWWLSAALTEETLMEEIQILYDSGFRGVELCMMSDGDALVYGYGGAEWSHKWNLIINKLLDMGMGVYLTSGTHWSTSNVPGLDPDSQAAMQIVAISDAFATVNASATFNSIVPIPSTRRNRANFIGAYALRQVSDNVADFDMVIDLTPFIKQGADVWSQNLTWTAPDSGTWCIYGLWSQGSYQSSNPAVQPSYCTNYFDVRGVQALKAFWEANYLNNPTLLKKILDGDVQLFMDSIEIGVGRGITWWTEDMSEVFMDLKGYDIKPYLFLLNEFSGASFWSNSYTAMPGTWKLGGDNEALREKIIFDYTDVLTTLLNERMLKPLKEWLNSVGIKTRAQVSYGKPFEMSEPIMYLDYPEAENRVMMNQVDYFRHWTGGAKLQNKVLSTESSAQSNTGHRLPRQYHLRDAYAQFAAGFQRMIWHIWSADFGSGESVMWPGATPGDRGVVFYRWGTREPSSRDYDVFNAHLGRVQQLVQTGKSRTDIGFITNKWYMYLSDSGEGTTVPTTPADINRMNWQLAHQGIFYRSTELQDNGYTYDYFSPKFLYEAPEVYLDEKTMTIEPAGYKALVIYQNWLDIVGARKILEWAKKGLPVVILGDAASRTPFYDGNDAELAAVIADMKLLPTVKTATVENYAQYFSAVAVGYEDNVMELLQEMGVYPYARFVEPNQQLLTQSRIDDDGNMYLYAYNYCPDTYHKHSHIEGIKNMSHGTNIKTEIMMDGMYIPYTIDAWTGKVTEQANYRYEDGRTIFPIDLDYDNIALFAFEAVKKEKLHIVYTDAESAYTTQNGLIVRATESGNYTAKLSDGTTFLCTVEVPTPYNITGWNISVESWTADTKRLKRVEQQIANPALTTVNTKMSTAKKQKNIRLNTLTTWDNISEVGREVSGTGHYEATFNWDSRTADGAYLDCGNDLNESMKVWINGQLVGGKVSTNPTKVKRSIGVTIDGVIPNGKDLYTGTINLMKPVADISEYLKDGKNKIVIEYSSNLTNILLSTGIIPATTAIYNWYNYIADYRSYGPAQAVIIPFVEKPVVQ